VQGTNAHLVLSASAAAAPSGALVTTGGAGVPLQQQVAWQPTRTWPLPPAHLLVSSASVTNRARVTFSCQLDSPRLAFLHAHNVLQQPLLPTSALLEVAAAAGVMLSSSASAESSMQCLQSIVFAAPCLLTQHAADLCCSISLDTGVLEVQSRSSGSSSSSGAMRLHMAGTLGTATVSPQQDSCGSRTFLQQMLAGQYRHLMEGIQHPVCCLAAAVLANSCSGLLSANSVSDGFVLHPAAMEAALQMQALQQEYGDSTDVAVSAPATIKACLLPGSTRSSVDEQLQISALLGCMQPQLRPVEDAAGYSHTTSSSMQLFSGLAMLGSVQDAEFRPMQRGMASAPPAAAGTAVPGGHDTAAATAATAGSKGPLMAVEEVSLLVQRTVEAVLGEAVDSQEPLMAAGLDSLGATEVRNSLQASLGMELPATLVSLQS